MIHAIQAMRTMRAIHAMRAICAMRAIHAMHAICAIRVRAIRAVHAMRAICAMRAIRVRAMLACIARIARIACIACIARIARIHAMRAIRATHALPPLSNFWGTRVWIKVGFRISHPQPLLGNSAGQGTRPLVGPPREGRWTEGGRSSTRAAFNREMCRECEQATEIVDGVL